MTEISGKPELDKNLIYYTDDYTTYSWVISNGYFAIYTNNLKDNLRDEYYKVDIVYDDGSFDYAKGIASTMGVTLKNDN